MQNTTDSPVLTVGSPFPPPPNLTRRLTPPTELGALPVLPLVTATVPKPAMSPVHNPFATSLNPSPPQRPHRNTRSGGARRFVSWMILLSVLGGIGAAAVLYGPEMLDRVRGDEHAGEPAAPLLYPVATALASPMRTATYTVARTDAVAGASSYTVTTDFETGIAQVIIDRGDRPDIEILTAMDQAVVRLEGQDTWYGLARGDFPLDVWAGRTRWVRTLDETLPAALRPAMTIEQATESSVDTTAARRLVVAVDAAQLTALLPAPTAQAPGDPAAVDPTMPPPTVMPPGLTLRGTDHLEPLRLELWIDHTGLVRKIVAPEAFGGETVTVTSVSADPFTPAFPPLDAISPLDARGLLALGL